MNRSTLAAPRMPALALVMSFVLPGLGQVYCGRGGRGLALMMGVAAPCALASIACALGASWFWFAWALVLSMGLTIFALVDAYRLARSSDQHFALRAYNRPLVYSLAIVMALVLPVANAFFVRHYVAHIFHVPTTPMAPTIPAGSRVVVNKVGYDASSARRGDIAVYRGADGRYWIRRVVALPGDLVETKDGGIYVKGVRVGDALSDAQKIQKVGSDELFLLADQPSDARDGRHEGMTPEIDLVGRVSHRWLAPFGFEPMTQKVSDGPTVK